MSHAIQNIAFILNNLFQEQHAGVIKPTGRLGSAIESTVGVALLWRGWLCYLPAGVLYLRRSVRWWVGGGRSALAREGSWGPRCRAIIIHGIFEANSSFYVKWRSTRKV